MSLFKKKKIKVLAHIKVKDKDLKGKKKPFELELFKGIVKEYD